MMQFKNYTKWQVETTYGDEDSYQDVVFHYEEDLADDEKLKTFIAD